ncbi:MAG TPA: SUMF1/EgtB/PvdO family nonheme iron enzyme, partial [Blastocatellia bacterium]|nr:SUMF1/EgtB/PvdO family nonheme iron enzyme [Blastocatellia bacterium]
GTSDYEIRRGHIEMPVPPMADYYPGIPAELEKVVFKALEKNPDDRYQTAHQFRELIEEYEQTGLAKITGRMFTARQTVIQEGRGGGRQSLADAPTVGIGQTLLTGADRSSGSFGNSSNNDVGHSSGNLSSAEHYLRQRNVRATEEQKSKLPLFLGITVLALMTIGISYWLLTRPKPPVDPNHGQSSVVPSEMISIAGGEFMMGRDDGNDYEKPAHNVTVESFLIDRLEVTNDQYSQFVRQTRHQPPSHWPNGQYQIGKATLPVVNVSWYDAKDYCDWAGKRLPTEEEWEFAARGKDGRLYPYGGNQWKPRFSNAKEVGLEEPQPVGSYPDGASPFGVLDMSGNVAEWIASDYKPYPNSPARSEEGNKIIRGGGFRVPAKEQTATDRFFDRPNVMHDFIGFRCAKNVR